MVVVRRGHSSRLVEAPEWSRVTTRQTSRPLLFSSLGILGVASTVMWSIWTIVVHLVTPPINKRGNDFLSGNHDFAFAAFLGLVPQLADGSDFAEAWKEYEENEERRVVQRRRL
uniref:Uncharacterized protein n=1 Tax=Cannabis sativa TaxID=3483 RepID=A0A803P2V1_CANSA